MYECSTEENGLMREWCFEDPYDSERPRLCVSLGAVLALKVLVEEQVAKCAELRDTLNECRNAYFKELRYLREALEAQQVERDGAGKKSPYQDQIDTYEVFFFEPPWYLDVDTRALLDHCIRKTNEKILEELFALRDKLALYEGTDGGSLTDTIERMIKLLLRQGATPVQIIEAVLRLAGENGRQ